MLRVRTCRIGTVPRPGDLLDVTRKSGKEGIVFAPSWRLLTPYLNKRRAGGFSGTDWENYKSAYAEEMRASWRAHRAAWESLLSRSRVTLACYCTDAARCHRGILADLLVQAGAFYEGEIGH